MHYAGVLSRRFWHTLRRSPKFVSSKVCRHTGNTSAPRRSG